VRSCTNGEKVVRGGGKEGVRRSAAWGRVVAQRPYRRRSRERSGDEVTALRHTRSGGTQTARRRHGGQAECGL
jgi:hypothetical protein